MNERQQYAFDNPCKTESELYGWNLRRDAPMPGGILTSHLSIRLFEKPLAWQCSIGICDEQFAPVPYSAWSHNTITAAITAAQLILAGVGQGVSLEVKPDQYCLRFRRLLTGDEQASLGQATARAVAPEPMRALPAASMYVVDTHAQ